MKLKNKVIVITGASDGIGKQIALRLAKENSKLALIARDKKRLSEVCTEAKNLGATDVKTYTCDIRQTDKLEIVLKSLISDFGNIDILINNAGIWQKLMPVDEISKEVVDDVIGTNLLALIHVTRLLLPFLRMRDEAAIINVISKSGVVAQEGQSIYTASKYGVRGFTEVLKIDLEDTNIKVAGVYQSGTNTKMFEKTGENFPTEKFTNPSDLADVIAYMLTRPDQIWLHDISVEK
jgi:short-subunit dehydrogenase